ncbi:acyl carrier protein [Providencia manganoxydans]|uniref:acyl carrier protein n=1 Tax=Providencia manganoxydans TaxID=2923283 RepID=UPI00280C403C|nr:acyl carrier protein [Providencia stuartii]ELR5083472.1 acyl carrier protein [Providencia stuartii]
MSFVNLSHQQWLINQIKEIRTYSGINKPITMDSALILDLHIDSLEMLELVTAIEEYTAQPLNDKVWLKWHYLQDVADYLAVTMGGGN